MHPRELKAMEWRGDVDGALMLLDQRRLPVEEAWLELRTVDGVAAAIREMAVRGAPAIGIAAAYGVVLAARDASRRGYPAHAVREAVLDGCDKLARTRPTAVNLFWALERCQKLAREGVSEVEPYLELARSIHDDDARGNRRIGEWGQRLIFDGANVLTHCNAGALATGGWGTALAPIFVAHEQGKRVHVWVDETRPRLQGARLTAWELSKVGEPHTLICDGAAASLMARGKIDLCLTGADRIAANGDVANKIGTYSVAVSAVHHGIPFHVAAPASTFDRHCPDGDSVVIEERSASEVTDWANQRTCPANSGVYNPAFDVTPAKLIRSILTEHGEIAPVEADSIARVLGDDGHGPRPTQTTPSS